MRKIMLLFTVLFIAINIIASDDPIKIRQRTVTIDYTINQDSIEGTFVIHNLTDKKIQVLGKDKQCTCSSVVLSNIKEIPPRDSLFVTMKTAINKNSVIDTYSVIILDTDQKYYRLRLKGNPVE